MKKIISSPITIIALFIVAVGLILSSSIGGTLAVLNFQSDDFLAQIELDHTMGVVITEKSAGEQEPRLIWNNESTFLAQEYPLLTHLVPAGEEFVPGKDYQEELAVRNTGNITEYVRVTVYKYWMRNGIRDVSLDPALIKLTFSNNGWQIDEQASTTERTVLYYTNGPITAGEQTTDFVKSIKVDTAALSAEYAGASFHIACVVDGVQNHNAGQAIASTWGYNFLNIE